MPLIVFGDLLNCTLQWGEHGAALSRLAVGQTLMVNQLVDMEWKFGGKNEPKSDITYVDMFTVSTFVNIHMC